MKIQAKIEFYVPVEIPDALTCIPSPDDVGKILVDAVQKTMRKPGARILVREWHLGTNKVGDFALPEMTAECHLVLPFKPPRGISKKGRQV